MYGIVICKSFYFTKSLLINDIFLRYKCPVKSFAFFLLAFINFWVWVFVYMLRKRYCAMLFHSYIHVTWLLCCQISGSKNTFFNSRPKYSRFACCRFSNLFKDHRQPKQEVLSGLSWQSFYSLPEWVRFSQWGQKKMQKSSLCSLFLIEAHLAHF